MINAYNENMINEADLFYRFGAALFIGFLVGLQREYDMSEASHKRFAGVRTFTLMSLAGCAAGLVADDLKSPLVLPGVLIVLGALLTAGYLASIRQNKIGLTTDMAALVTILAGMLCYSGRVGIAVALGVAATALLSLKLEFRAFIRHITRDDVFATLKFAVITAIVLPVLPNQSYGIPPLDVLNPYSIWLMVVFISGISFLGYLLVKVLSPNRGITLSGLLGGLVSSMAVTLSLTERSKQEEDLSRSFALAIILSWVMMFLRVAVIAAALNMALLEKLWLPLVVTAAASLGYCAYLFYTQKEAKANPISHSNPFNLGPAILFGLFYAFILLVSKAAQVYLGATGVFLSSLAAGLADLNAISLSLAGLSTPGGGLSLVVAAQGIMLASMANTLVKGIVALTSGAPGLRKPVLPGLLIMLVIGSLSIFFIR